VVRSTPQPQFTPGKDPAPNVQEAGWAPGPVWTGGKSRPHRDSIPDRPARRQSLYRLSYPAHTHTHTHIYIYISVCVCVCVCVSKYVDLNYYLLPFQCLISKTILLEGHVEHAQCISSFSAFSLCQKSKCMVCILVQSKHKLIFNIILQTVFNTVEVPYAR